jgi:hypothetical protein
MVQIFADSNRARMRYVKESDSAWGTTPGSGVTRELRYTGSTLNAQKDTAVSEEIRADRMVPSYIDTGRHSSGEINIEFSAGSHDDFMEGFAYGAWTRPMTFDFAKGTSVQWGTTAILYISGIDLSTYFTVGHRIKVSGFVNPSNNDYFEISAISFNGGADRTEITVTTSVAVIETGSAYTKVEDANDVIVLKNTSIRSGTASASAFDSNSTNAFAAAIAAGQLGAGQKIYVEGLGYESGSIAFASYGTNDLAAGTVVTLSDGTNTYNFQFGGSIPAGYISVAKGAANTNGATNLAAAINALRPNGSLNVRAKVTSATVTLTNLNTTGGSISKSGDTNTTLTILAFSGGAASEHGFFTIVSATDDVLTVSPAPATNANAGSIGVSVKGSMLRNPADAGDIVPHSFSFETGFEDVNEFFTADGQRIGTWALNVSAGAILTGSYGLQGRGMARALVTTLGNTGSYTVLGTTATPVSNATSNVGTIYKDGVALSTALKTISFSGNNNLRDQMAVGSRFPVGIGAGRIEFTGNVEAYFSDGDLWDNFINHDFVSLNFGLTDVDENHYEFTFPNVCFSTDTVNPAGGNQDVMENMQWMAMRDPITDCMFQVDRFSSTSPVLG